MQKWEKALFQLIVVAGAFFAWLIAIEVGMLPANFRGNGALFRWQVWLLTGLCLVASRDFVSQIRCRNCGSRERISPLRLLPRRELLCRNCLGWDSSVPAENPTTTSALPDVLQPFWTRRPNKTWLPASWVSATRVNLRRWTVAVRTIPKTVSGMRHT